MTARRLPYPGRLLLSIVLAGSWGTLQGQPKLECRISIERLPNLLAPTDERTASSPQDYTRVEIECILPQRPSTRTRLIGIRFPGQKFEQLDVSFPDVPVDLDVQARTVRVDLPRNLPGWSLSYRLRGDQRRIPILVPDGNWETTIQVEVALHGRKLAEPSFPPLETIDDRLTGSLPHLPGFIFLPLVEAGRPGDILSIQGWVDLSILILIVAASLYWARLRRRARLELAGNLDRGTEGD